MDSKSDRGAVSTEFAVVFGAFVLFASTVLVAGKLAQSEIDIRNAAQEAARAATLERDAGSAQAVAVATATAQISRCDNPSVIVDTNGFRPGNVVTVTVACEADVMFSTRHLSATAHEIIDVYRGSS